MRAAVMPAPLLFAWLLAWLLAVPAPAHRRLRSAFPLPAFSVETITASPIESPVRERIYRFGGRLRVDLPQGGYQLYQLKRKAAYRIGRGGRCTAIPFRPPPGAEPFLWRGHVRRKMLGKATLAGHAVRIEQITVRGRRGRHVFVAWVAPDGFPRRVQMVTPGGPLEVIYRGVRLAPPAPARLLVPAACRPPARASRLARTAGASATRGSARNACRR